jgi:hypothetical protein
MGFILLYRTLGYQYGLIPVEMGVDDQERLILFPHQY